MAMRYIFRRPKPDELSDLKSQIGDLEQQLGQATDNARRLIKVRFSPSRYAQYSFFTRKTGATWAWIAPSVELVAEDEKGLFALTEKFHLPKPAHLAHL